jgi:hypothetical protein
MSLPELSHLQFLMIRLLFAEPRTGKELRRLSKAESAKLSPPSFSRLTQRMERLNYLHSQDELTASGRRYVRPRRFQVTDLGIVVWSRAREFYVTSAPPPPDLVSIATDEGQLAHLPRPDRKRILQRRRRRQIKRIVEKCLPAAE